MPSLISLGNASAGNNLPRMIPLESANMAVIVSICGNVLASVSSSCAMQVILSVEPIHIYKPYDLFFNMLI